MNAAAPLAERMRPQTLETLIGQEHLVGRGSILRTAIESGHIPSLILWGPPGTGKTTIANVIAHTLNMPFFTLSAISAGVKEVRDVIAQAQKLTGTILFIDEIHRFNKGQQDALLGAVEKGTVTLIGATTENPSFEVNSALLSRCQVYVLKPLSEENLVQLLQNAIANDPFLKEANIELKETEALLTISGGDARKLLNLLELVANSLSTSGENIALTDDTVMQIAQQRIVLYDKSGEQHYDIISAFIKSMRGSDPNGAIYWLARMIEGGEDVKFIARRMVIFASEDIGNANPNALLLANATFEAVAKIGYPEAVRKEGDLPVPLDLRNAKTGLMKSMGYGKSYKYAHHYEGNFTEQEFLPDALSGTTFYEPGKTPREDELRKYLRSLWKDKYNY